MANLVSPGVLVTVTDQSYYVPAYATTVPLFFIATADNKTQADGVTPASGTYESNIIRPVTSIGQSMALYGVPNFLVDTSGNPLHGDSRNEYGLFALNQYLGVGNLAYVIRAYVNLNDNYASTLAAWYADTQNAATALEILASAWISNYNNQNGYVPTNPLYKQTINQATFETLVAQAMATVYSNYSFRLLTSLFENDHTAAPLNVFNHTPSATPGDWYNYAATGIYLGVAGMASQWVASASGSVVTTEFTPTEAYNVLNTAAALFEHTEEFLSHTSLGTTDAARRVAIVAALNSSANASVYKEMVSDAYEFNIVICPGYPELNVALNALSVNLLDEVFVIGEVPLTIDPDALSATWTPPVSTASSNIAYYYPHGLASNLDGADVFIAASGIALRTITYSDNASEVWFAPAGTTRGAVSGVSNLGYVSGTLGTATKFVPVNLTQGQRDSLYGIQSTNTAVNPIINMPSYGMLVFGQRTAIAPGKSMDRINVSRLVKYIKRSLRKQLIAFLFEPNDKTTQDNVKSTVDAFLTGIMNLRGLYDFVVICDSSNNTPATIQANQLWVDIALKPEIAIEFIYVPINIVNTGAVLPNGAGSNG